MKNSIFSIAQRRKLKGFTLVEMVVVIAIVGILCAIIVPNMVSYQRTAKITAANSNAQQVYNAAQDYLMNLETSGKEARDYFGIPTSNVCYLIVDYGAAKPGRGADGDNAKIQKADIYMVGSAVNPGTTLQKMGKTAANGIAGYLDGTLEGAWAVAIYPDTFTVKYAVYSAEPYKDSSSSVAWTGAKYNAEAVYELTRSDTNLYTSIFGSDSRSQENEYLLGSNKRYTGQYPVPVT